MKPVKYYPKILACPFCTETPSEGEEPRKWSDKHFLMAFAKINFENAEVLFVNLVCSKKAEEISRRDRTKGLYFEDEVAEIVLWLPIQADYGRGEPFIVPLTDGEPSKPETIH